MATAQLREVQMAYTTDGRGEPLILIGGFTMVKESWEPQIAALAEHFRVVCPDNRGVGETIAPSGPFTIADMAADTVGLMDALGLPAAHICGMSMGGMIGQIMAIEMPQRVTSLISMMSTTGEIDLPPSTPASRGRRPFAQRVPSGHDLADDLALLQVAHQTLRAGVAKPA